MSELKIINTKQYNSELDEVCKNKTDIFIKTKLTRRVTFGEYQFEPKNWFETDNAYYSQPINLDKCEVYYLHQPTLNENQQIVLEWLKREHFDSYIKSVLSNLYFYVNMTAIDDLENKEIQEMVNAYEKLSQEDFAQVLQVFSQRALEQEEE